VGHQAPPVLVILSQRTWGKTLASPPAPPSSQTTTMNMFERTSVHSSSLNLEPRQRPWTCLNVLQFILEVWILSKKLQDCTFLRTASRSFIPCTYISLSIRTFHLAPPHPATCRARLVGIIPFLRTNYRCFFNSIFLEIEVCEFPSSFSPIVSFFKCVMTCLNPFWAGISFF